MPSKATLKKPGGRPRKHSSAAAAIEAKKLSDRRRYLRSLQAQAPVDFIAFEPPLHTDVPADTPPDIGLRTSFDVQIPAEPNVLQDDTLTIHQPIPLPRTKQPTSDENAEIAAQIQQVRSEEQENVDQIDYEATISQHLNKMDKQAAEILIGLRGDVAVDGTQTGQSPVKAYRNASTNGMVEMEAQAIHEDRGCDEEHSRSCFHFLLQQ